MDQLISHIQDMGDQEFWDQLGQEIQNEVLSESTEYVAISLTVSPGMLEYNDLGGCITPAITWGVDDFEYAKDKLSDADALLIFERKPVPVIGDVRDELLRSLEQNRS